VVPVLYGCYAKLAVVPVSPGLKALTDRYVDFGDNPDGLREAVRQYFDQQGGVWELQVQLATDSGKMPVEDASVVWSEEQSPYLTVVRIEVGPQPAWSAKTSRPSMMEWHSAPGMAWPATARWAVSCEYANPPMKCPPASGLSTTAAPA
jgi:hypothetical protein